MLVQESNNKYWERILTVFERDIELQQDEDTVSFISCLLNVDEEELNEIKAGRKATSIHLAFQINKIYPQYGLHWILGGGRTTKDERNGNILGYWVLEDSYSQYNELGIWMPIPLKNYSETIIWIFKKKGEVKLYNKIQGGLSYQKIKYDYQTGELIINDCYYIVTHLSAGYLSVLSSNEKDSNNAVLMTFRRVGIPGF